MAGLRFWFVSEVVEPAREAVREPGLDRLKEPGRTPPRTPLNAPPHSSCYLGHQGEWSGFNLNFDGSKTHQNEDYENPC